MTRREAHVIATALSSMEKTAKAGTPGRIRGFFQRLTGSERKRLMQELEKGHGDELKLMSQIIHETKAIGRTRKRTAIGAGAAYGVERLTRPAVGQAGGKK